MSLTVKLQSFLERNNRYVKQLASSYALFFINSIVMILITPFLLNRLGKEPYGIWILSQNIVNYFNLFNFGYLSTLVLKYTQIDHDDVNHKKAAFTTVFYSIVLFSLLTIPAYFIVQYNFEDIFKLSASNAETGKGVFSIVYIAFFILFIGSTIDCILYYILGNIITKNIIEITKLLILNGGYFVFISTGFGLTAMALYYMAVSFVFVVIIYFVVAKDANLSLNTSYFSLSLFKSYFKVGLSFFVLNLTNVIIFNGDNVLISILLGVEYLAMYTISFRLSDLAIKLIRKLTETKSPELIQFIREKNFHKLKKVYKKLILTVSALSLCAGLGIIALGKIILTYWVGSNYDFDNRIIIVFALYIPINSVYYVCWVIMNITGWQAKLSRIVIIEIVVNILLSIILCHFWGIFGIALATLVSSLLTSFWYSIWQCILYFKENEVK